jgi:hypothetical protein
MLRHDVVDTRDFFNAKPVDIDDDPEFMQELDEPTTVISG